MFILCVVSLVILAFRFTSKPSCDPFKISVDNDTPRVGDAILLKAERRGSGYEWDFGDGTTDKDIVPTMRHVFKTPGKHTISVLVDGSCDHIINLVVLPRRVQRFTSIQPPIVAVDKAYIGDQITFEDTSSSSTSWEWRFEDGEKIGSTVRSPVYTYSTPGERFVVLKVNGSDDRIVSHRILILAKEERQQSQSAPKKKAADRVVYVQESPKTPPLDEQKKDEVQTEEKKPEPVKMAPTISTDDLSAMLKLVVEGKKKAEDFSDYLCGQLDMPVMYNGKASTFRAMCTSLEKYRKKKVKNINVVPTRNQQNNCIQSMNVTLDKRFFPI